MDSFLNPEKILKKLRLKDNMIAADFGCGSGGWVIPLAKKLEGGIVYAIDILEEPLSALKAKAKLAKIFNVETIKSNIEGINGSRLVQSSCDLVLMTNLLFQCENKKQVLEEGIRILKPGGRILVVDWKKDAQLGPTEGRVPIGEVRKITKELGLTLEKEFSASPYHYGLIFRKSR